MLKYYTIYLLCFKDNRPPSLESGKATQRKFGQPPLSSLATTVYPLIALCHASTVMKLVHRVTVGVMAEAAEGIKNAKTEGKTEIKQRTKEE